MKKNLSYKEQLIELAQIYDVKEIKDYVKRRKDLTAGQLELILRKNKIVIPKDFKTSFFKENFTKPLSKVSKRIDNLKEDSSKKVSRVSRKITYFKEDSSRNFSRLSSIFWRSLGKIGLAFLNIIPKLGSAIYQFFGRILTDLFNGIYNQQISAKSANRAVLGFFVIIGLMAVVIIGANKINEFKNDKIEKVVKKEEIKKIEPKLEKKKTVPEIKKPEIKKEVKKPEKKLEEKKLKQNELILPDLNLKTETVLNLFKDVNYDLNRVRNEKRVKPIYFTQFPKDLDAIQSVKLKKETFIKIVLPLIVAENEKILDDRIKLNKITKGKFTTDQEKQWLRQKFLEYKVKGGNLDELKLRMDIIPTSIALAQAAKESGWGTSRFALEGNAIFGQWTWSGSGIAPLLRDKSKSHKILRFPILRASVKAYKNNLNTHKSYKKFRESRQALRKKNKRVIGLELTKTLASYAETGSDYIKILEQIIVQNRLQEFETVKLSNSMKKRQLDL